MKLCGCLSRPASREPKCRAFLARHKLSSSVSTALTRSSSESWGREFSALTGPKTSLGMSLRVSVHSGCSALRPRSQADLTLRRPGQSRRKCVRSSRADLLQHLHVSDTPLCDLASKRPSGRVLLRTLNQSDAALPSIEEVYGCAQV